MDMDLLEQVQQGLKDGQGWHTGRALGEEDGAGAVQPREETVQGDLIAMWTYLQGDYREDGGRVTGQEAICASCNTGISD